MRDSPSECTYYSSGVPGREIMSADSPAALEQAIERYNAAWSDHDLDAIVAMHAPDMVFENHTAGESASAAAVRELRGWADQAEGGVLGLGIDPEAGRAARVDR